MDKRITKSVDFYEKNPPIKFQLEQISCLATDFNVFDKRSEIDEFTVRVYGRVIRQVPDHKSEKNVTPEELGLDVMRKVPHEGFMYMVKVHSLELSIAFAK